MFVQGSAIDKKFKGSLEHQALIIKNAIEEHFGESPIRILATHPAYAFVMDDDGKMLKLTYEVKKDQVTEIKAKPTKEIPIIEDEDVPLFVANSLHTIVEAAMKDKPIPRTQVREVAQLLDKDELYWITDILKKIDEANEEAEWFNMYEANQEKIRTAMYGSIRELESPFPSTKFTQIAPSKLHNFESELREALVLISGLISDIVDECSKMVFDQEEDEFFCAICESLTVEAQAIGGLLGKAEKLMRIEDVGRMAEAHDRLAERAKTMAVVTAYLKTRSRPNDNEE